MTQPNTSNGWLSGISSEVRCLCVISFLSAVGFGIQSPAIPILGSDLGMGSTMIGMVVAVFALARLLLAWPSGKLIDVWGEYWLLSGGLWLIALGSFGAGLSNSASGLLFYRGLCGAGSIFYSVAAMNLMLRTTDAAYRGKAAGLFMSAYYIGTVSGPALGSSFIEMSVRLPFFVYGAGSAAAALFALVLLRHLRQPQAPGNEASSASVSMPQALRQPIYRASIATNFSIGFAVYGVRVSVLPLFLLAVLQQPAHWIGIGLTVGALAQIITLPLAGRLTDNWGRKPSMVLGLAFTLGSFIAIIMLESLATYLLGLALMGLGSGLCSTSSAAAAGDTADGRGGTVIASYQMAADLGMVVGPVLIGLLAERYSYSLALGTTAALIAVTLLTTAMAANKKNQDTPHA